MIVTGVEPCDKCAEGHPKKEYLNTCRNSYGNGRTGIHNAITRIGEVPELDAWDAFGKKDYPENRWPTACSDCGTVVPRTVKEPEKVGEVGFFTVRQLMVKPLYDTPSGSPDIGSVFYRRWHDPGDCPYWDNCEGVHVIGILPNGHEWDIDSRCSNCTMRGDRTHRCWVRSGSPEAGNLTVGKGGVTCAAGGGSILVDGWHGFLTNFEWREC